MGITKSGIKKCSVLDTPTILLLDSITLKLQNTFFNNSIIFWGIRSLFTKCNLYLYTSIKSPLFSESDLQRLLLDAGAARVEVEHVLGHRIAFARCR